MTAPNEISPPEKPISPPRPKNYKYGFLLFLFTFLIIVLAGLSFIQYSLLKANTHALTSLKKKTQDLTNTLLSQQEQIKTLDHHIKATSQQPAQALDHLSLLQARFYLQLASINAHWSQNWEGTRLLLFEASQAIKNNTSNPIYSLREAITKDINQIEAYQGPDKVGLMSQLDLVQASIDKLPTNIATAPSSNTDTSPSTSIWEKSVSQLKKLVIVKSRINTDNIITAQQRLTLREVLHLHCSAAQVGLLQYNWALYHYSLSYINKVITHYYDPQAPAVLNLKNQIETLLKPWPNPPSLSIAENIKQVNLLLTPGEEE